MIIRDKELFDSFCIKIKMDGYEVCETQENGSDQTLKKVGTIGEAVQHILNMRVARSPKEITLKEYYEFTTDFNKQIEAVLKPVASAPKMS